MLINIFYNVESNLFKILHLIECKDFKIILLNHLPRGYLVAPHRRAPAPSAEAKPLTTGPRSEASACVFFR